MSMKKTMGLFLAMCMLVGMLSGCGGGKKDWSKTSFTDYDPEEFLTKTEIEYSLGVYDDSTAVDQYAFLAPTHLMLYKDGSAAAASCFLEKGAFGDIGKTGLPIYDDNGVLSMSFGFWEKNGDTITIKLNLLYLADYYDVENGGKPKAGVNLADVLKEYEYEATIENGVITLLDFQSYKDTGAMVHPIQTVSLDQYSSLKAWLDTIPEADPNVAWGGN